MTGSIRETTLSILQTKTSVQKSSNKTPHGLIQSSDEVTKTSIDLTKVKPDRLSNKKAENTSRVQEEIYYAEKEKEKFFEKIKNRHQVTKEEKQLNQFQQNCANAKIYGVPIFANIHNHKFSLHGYKLNLGLC